MIAYIFVIIVLTFLLLLFIPLTFYGQGSFAGALSADVTLTWAGGLIASHWYLTPAETPRSTIRIGPWIRKESQHEPKSPIRKKEMESRSNGFKWEFIKTCLNKQVFQEICLFLDQIRQSLRLRGTLTGEFGTDDPALTGYITALIAILSANGFTVRLTPQFADTTLILNGDIKGRIIPGITILNLGIFIFKKPIRIIWLTLLHNRNKKLKRRKAYV